MEPRTRTLAKEDPPMADQRRFIRHPASVPIIVSGEETDAANPPEGRAQDVSAGGLSFLSSKPLKRGRRIRIVIPHVKPPFESTARVCWCHRSKPRGYMVGVQFNDKETLFRMRMVEQICHIEEYRRSVLECEGRDLDPAAAAEEWISRFAAGFPNPDN